MPRCETRTNGAKFDKLGLEPQRRILRAGSSGINCVREDDRETRGELGVTRPTLHSPQRSY